MCFVGCSTWNISEVGRYIDVLWFGSEIDLVLSAFFIYMQSKYMQTFKDTIISSGINEIRNIVRGDTKKIILNKIIALSEIKKLNQ